MIDSLIAAAERCLIRNENAKMAIWWLIVDDADIENAADGSMMALARVMRSDGKDPKDPFASCHKDSLLLWIFVCPTSE